jgi:hypothetical protein
MNLRPTMKTKPASYGEVTQNLALQNIQARPNSLSVILSLLLP